MTWELYEQYTAILSILVLLEIAVVVYIYLQQDTVGYCEACVC